MDLAEECVRRQVLFNLIEEIEQISINKYTLNNNGGLS